MQSMQRRAPTMGWRPLTMLTSCASAVCSEKSTERTYMNAHGQGNQQIFTFLPVRRQEIQND